MHLEPGVRTTEHGASIIILEDPAPHKEPEHRTAKTARAVVPAGSVPGAGAPP
jgi:hypothetical protein